MCVSVNKHFMTNVFDRQANTTILNKCIKPRVTSIVVAFVMVIA